MATIGSNIKARIKDIRKSRLRPRIVVMNWMKRNNLWYRELVAKEWQRQTGEDWEALFWRTVQ